MSTNTILHGKVNFPVCLAPMVGLSHVALREVLREYLPSNAFTIWPTEMLNSRRIPAENLSTTPETLRGPNETGLVPQILGNEETAIAKSVACLEKWGAEGIDINMGCPVSKALRHNYGVALMGDPEYAAEVVRMTVRNTKLPVSVKLRAMSESEDGTKDKNSVLLDFVERIQSAGAQWICLHPRTASQKRRGKADWSQIRFLKDQLNIPVIGNGDIQTYEDALAMLDQTKCDMAMIGRALAAKPWMLWQIGTQLGFKSPAGKDNLCAPYGEMGEGAEYGKVLQRLIYFSRIYFTEDLALRKIRFWIRTTAVWLLFGQSLMSLSNKARTLTELESLAMDFFAKDQPMSQQTELRQ